MGVEVIRPDVFWIDGCIRYGSSCSGNGGRVTKGESTLLDSEGLNSLQVSTTMRNCGLCPNNCMLTINAFSDGRTYVTGNRCDRGAGDMIQEKRKPVPNLVECKNYDRLNFDY